MKAVTLDKNMRVRVQPAVFRKYTKLAALAGSSLLSTINEVPTVPTGHVYKRLAEYIVVKHDDGGYFPWKPEELIYLVI